jgi:MFS transporter, FSR family, fosmidomycin resistance protein
VAAPPLTLVFIQAGGVVGAAALALVGVCVVSTFGLTGVMSQEYLPSRIGLASGVSIGFSIGLGGIAALALGARYSGGGRFRLRLERLSREELPLWDPGRTPLAL